MANGLHPPGFKGKDRAQTFRDVIGRDKDPPGGKNYSGTQEEWEQIDRRQGGREGRKFRERRDKRSKESIVDEVLKGADVTVDELKSQSQARRVVRLRTEAMARMYDEGYGPTEIGKYVNQAPGSVNNAWNRWNERQNQ